MQKVKVIESRYKQPLEDEINRMLQQGWKLFTFEVKGTPQGLLYIASLKRKKK